jgi:hypothetical protein
MSPIDGILFMNFDQLSTAVVNLLPKPDGLFVSIHFLEIARLPTLPTGDFKPLLPAATRQLMPLSKLPLVLLSTAHPCRVSYLGGQARVEGLQSRKQSQKPMAEG